MPRRWPLEKQARATPAMWRFIRGRRIRERILGGRMAREVVRRLQEVGAARARVGRRLLRGVFSAKQDTPTDGELGEIADEMVGLSGWLQARDNSVPKMRVLGSAWYGAVLDELPGQVGRLGLDIVVGAADPVSELVIEEGGRRLGLIDLDKGVRERVFRILQQARHEQLGVPEITRRLATEIPAGRFRTPEIRARVIARSEIKHAQRVSSMRMYDSMPEVQLVLVFDAVLGDTDPDCEARNGREVDLATADAMITSPMTHPNCTLDFAPIVVN